MMDWSLLPDIAIYMLSLLISCGVGVYSLTRRQTAGALALTGVALAQATWTFGYMLELITPTLDGKIFWDSFQLLGGALWPVALLAFALNYTGQRLQHPRLVWSLLSIINILLFSDIFYGNNVLAGYQNAVLVSGEPFSALVYDLNNSFKLYIYFLVLMLYGMGLLAAYWQRTQAEFRQQSGLVIIGHMIPLVGTTLTLIGVTLTFQRDTTPVTFAIGNLLVAWALFRHGLLDIVPIAREKIFERMPDAVVVVDKHDRIIDLNEVARQTADRPRSAIIGQPTSVIYADWVAVMQPFKSAATAQSQIIREIDGEKHHFDMTISPIHDQRGQLTGRIIVVRDITEVKRIEESLVERTMEVATANIELAEANEQLHKLSRIKDDFVSNVSHELRTPIASILINLEMTRRQPQRRATFIDRIERETERLDETIENLLRLSRFDQGRVQLKKQKIDLNDMVRQFVDDRVSLAAGKQIKLTCDMSAVPPLVNVDPGLVEQVLSILVTNAINYTPDDGHIHVYTEFVTEPDQKWVTFNVRDTGMGIEPSELDKIFNRFYRGISGVDSGVQGTGLGLAIAQEIVERHGGQILVHSPGRGKGTTFNVRLPAAEANGGVTVLAALA